MQTYNRRMKKMTLCEKLRETKTDKLKKSKVLGRSLVGQTTVVLPKFKINFTVTERESRRLIRNSYISEKSCNRCKML